MKDVYYLSVEEANKIAKRHEHEERWEIWTDPEARKAGELAGMLARLNKSEERRSA